MAKFDYSKEQINKLIEGIYAGLINPLNLPVDLYSAIGDYLEHGLSKGFGGILSEFELGSPDYELLSELRNNIYLFSGAKTFQQVKEMSDLLGNKEIPSLSDFKEQAKGIFDIYDETWLETEYNTAIGQAQSAAAWSKIEQNKETFPYLQYDATMDANTDEDCASLHGITLPVDDPFWDDNSPLLHFNCRCTLIPIDVESNPELTSQEDAEAAAEGVAEHISPLFGFNPGKEGYIFSAEHPYFDVGEKYEKLARENFNLPIPKEK